ncbi:hypothetical protein DBV39_04775 [Orrella marina]|uniref:Uncharacterized protein n=1 Tax=Orrella marina TaxID=2163011 RepID=A0A2R4XH35_9BURK|nr:hypothetical protein DBV39_04775 [Orrella marina]
MITASGPGFCQAVEKQGNARQIALYPYKVSYTWTRFPPLPGSVLVDTVDTGAEEDEWAFVQPDCILLFQGDRP